MQWISKNIQQLVLGVLLATGCTWAQDKPDYYYDVLGEASVGFLMPSAFGDNYIAEGYSLDPGIQIRGGIRVDPKLLLGGDFQFYYGRVTNPEITGAFRGSNIRRLMVFGQYNLLDERSDLAVQAGLEFGVVILDNHIAAEEFRDDGISTGFSLDVSYRFSTTFGVYAHGLLVRDWMNIKTAPGLEDSFKRVDYFIPSVGIRLYIR